MWSLIGRMRKTLKEGITRGHRRMKASLTGSRGRGSRGGNASQSRGTWRR